MVGHGTGGGLDVSYLGLAEVLPLMYDYCSREEEPDEVVHGHITSLVSVQSLNSSSF